MMNILCQQELKLKVSASIMQKKSNPVIFCLSNQKLFEKPTFNKNNKLALYIL